MSFGSVALQVWMVSRNNCSEHKCPGPDKILVVATQVSSKTTYV